MTLGTCDAVYEKGVFRPVQGSPHLAEGQHVRLIVEQAGTNGLDLAAGVYQGLTGDQVDEIERIALDRLDARSEPRSCARTGKWSHLNHLQVGRYAEYLAKMEFTVHGFDVYTSEVDDKGIDFVIRVNGQDYRDVQVKAVRGFSYIFFEKEKFEIRENLLAAVVLFFEGEPPRLFLVPSTAWLNPEPPFCFKCYEGLKSPPEYGINIAKKHLPALERYAFETAVDAILHPH